MQIKRQLRLAGLDRTAIGFGLAGLDKTATMLHLKTWPGLAADKFLVQDDMKSAIRKEI